MIILYSVIYYFLSRFIDNDYLSENIVAILTEKSDFINYILYSSSVSLFNFSFTSFHSIYWLLAHGSITNMSKLYFNNTFICRIFRNTLERDNKFYIETHRILNKKSHEK